MAEVSSNAHDEFLDASDMISHCYKNCARTDSVQMIGCDAPGCDIEWFHIEYVGLSPDNIPGIHKKWMCTHCAVKDEEEAEGQQMTTASTQSQIKITEVKNKFAKKQGRQRSSMIVRNTILTSLAVVMLGLRINIACLVS